MPIIKKNGVEIYYEEAGTGFPLLVLPGGGLNATVVGLKDQAVVLRSCLNENTN